MAQCKRIYTRPGVAGAGAGPGGGYAIEQLAVVQLGYDVHLKGTMAESLGQ